MKGVDCMYSTVQEVADYFKVHTNTIRGWIKDGAPCYRNGKFIRIKLDEIENWLKENN